MKNFADKLRWALWVFSPIVILLSICAAYLHVPIKNAEVKDVYESPKKNQNSQSFHHLAGANTKTAGEM
jgi:hypothetical protein